MNCFLEGCGHEEEVKIGREDPQQPRGKAQGAASLHVVEQCKNKRKGALGSRGAGKPAALAESWVISNMHRVKRNQVRGAQFNSTCMSRLGHQGWRFRLEVRGSIKASGEPKA